MSTQSPWLLRIEQLVAGYQRPVVGPVSLEIVPGEVVGLWGANGSGKSTLLNALIGGARLWSGHLQRAPGLHVAYQEQQPVRLPVMPLCGRDLLRVAGVSRETSKLSPPPALAALLDRRLDRLSGGQYQVLSVWAALAGGADLILLDEPTNSLDPQTEGLLVELLSAPPKQAAVLLVSHEHRFLEAACSRVLGLSDLQGPG